MGRSMSLEAGLVKHKNKESRRFAFTITQVQETEARKGRGDRLSWRVDSFTGGEDNFCKGQRRAWGSRREVSPAAGGRNK